MSKSELVYAPFYYKGYSAEVLYARYIIHPGLTITKKIRILWEPSTPTNIKKLILPDK